MNRRECIVTTAKLIVETHGGQASFNFRQAAVILGCDFRLVPKRLDESGVLCTTRGKNKMVAAIGIAECIHYNQVSPLDNRLRPARAAARGKNDSPGAGKRAKPQAARRQKTGS